MPARAAFDDLFPARVTRPALAAFAVAMLAALWVRASYFLGAPLPLNDGALFLAFVQAIQQAGLALPDTVMFNGTELPFGYPPLSFWVTAALADVTGLDALLLVKYLPFALHLVFLALFAPLLRAFGMSWSGVMLVLTVAVFTHRSYEWLIMGGGLSRSMGAMWTMTAAVCAARGAVSGRIAWLLAGGLAVGCAVLSHPEWALDAVVLWLAITVFLARNLMQVARGIVVGAVAAAAVVLPWLWHVLDTHGWELLANAFSASLRGTYQFYRTVRAQIFPSFLTYFAIVGAWECLRRRAYLWPLILVAFMAATPRHFDTAAVIPNSVMAAVGIAMLWRLLTERLGETGLPGALRLSSPGAWWFPIAFAAAYTWFGTVSDRDPDALEPMDSADFAALQWVGENLPPDAPVLVLNPEPWNVDEISEWLPMVAGARAVGLVQGSEWLPDGAFEKTRKTAGAFKRRIGCPGLAELVSQTYPEARFVFVPSALRGKNMDCLSEFLAAKVLYEHGGVQVWGIKSDLAEP